MPFARYTPEQLQQSDIPPPTELDYLEFDFQGVTFRCYGILHGITGGLNREYRNYIKSGIRRVEGPKLGEKGMLQLYRGCGIDAELEDWLVLRKVDCLVMGFQLLADPRCLWMITVDALREQLRKRDRWVENGCQHIPDLGESPYFHYLEEQERRAISGFLPSGEAIANDLRSMSRWYGAILPRRRHQRIEHPQWHRILLLERIMHIPCRSVHMLHYALNWARRHDHSLVNIFVGETHNTDMHHLGTEAEPFRQSLDGEQQAVMAGISSRAAACANRRGVWGRTRFGWRKLNYLLFLLLGASLPLALYGGALWWLMA